MNQPTHLHGQDRYSQDINERMQDAIERFRYDLAAHTRKLESEGVWLFLATLGCWSVNQKAIQAIAILSTMFLFGLLLFEGKADSRTVPQRRRALEARIRAQLHDEGSVRARLDELNGVMLQEGSIVAQIKATPKFAISFAFFATTMLYFAFLLSR